MYDRSCDSNDIPTIEGTDSKPYLGDLDGPSRSVKNTLTSTCQHRDTPYKMVYVACYCGDYSHLVDAQYYFCGSLDYCVAFFLFRIGFY